jgi:hypothetical protein
MQQQNSIAAYFAQHEASSCSVNTMLRDIGNDRQRWRLPMGDLLVALLLLVTCSRLLWHAVAAGETMTTAEVMTVEAAVVVVVVGSIATGEVAEATMTGSSRGVTATSPATLVRSVVEMSPRPWTLRNSSFCV